jgi:hypothetical protein
MIFLLLGQMMPLTLKSMTMPKPSDREHMVVVLGPARNCDQYCVPCVN